MKSVNILGAGIAGMSAANFLAQSGFKATVYEKCSFVGDSRDGDYEGIENWIFSENVSDFIKKIGFNDKKITKYPVDEFYVHTDSSTPILIKNNLPFFSLVKRGSTKECIDYQLYKQCLENDVRFVFNSKKIDNWFGKSGFFVINNVFLFSSALVVFIGTIFPLIYETL